MVNFVVLEEDLKAELCIEWHMKSKNISHVFTFLPAEYFRSHLLAFSSNLDDHNPDVAEWRIDVSRVIKNALIQVKLSKVFSWETIASTLVNTVSTTSPRLSVMNLTFMMINDKARGRRGVKIQFKIMPIAVACAHTVSSGPHGNKVLNETYRGMNVSRCLMCVLHCPEGKSVLCNLSMVRHNSNPHMTCQIEIVFH